MTPEEENEKQFQEVLANMRQEEDQKRIAQGLPPLTEEDRIQRQADRILEKYEQYGPEPHRRIAEMVRETKDIARLCEFWRLGVGYTVSKFNTLPDLKERFEKIEKWKSSQSPERLKYIQEKIEKLIEDE